MIQVTGFRDLPYHVAFPVLPWTLFHRMFRCFSRPETETVVVFRCQDHLPEAGILHRFHPLTGIKTGGIEQGRILLSVTPLPVGEGVDPEVEEGHHLQFLPAKLPFGGHDIGGFPDDVVAGGNWPILVCPLGVTMEPGEENKLCYNGNPEDHRMSHVI